MAWGVVTESWAPRVGWNLRACEWSLEIEMYKMCDVRGDIYMHLNVLCIYIYIFFFYVIV